MTETWNEISLRQRRRCLRGWGLLVIAAAAIAWLCLLDASRSAGAEPQLIDCTVSGELADMKGVVRMPGEYHLWNLGDVDKKSIVPAVWRGANERVARGDDVWLDIEPDVSPRADWRRPINLAKASPAEVRRTMRMIAAELAPLCERAKWTGSQVWTYRILSDLHARGEVVANAPDEYFASVRAMATHEYEPGRTLAADLAKTGGGELYEVYIPNQWNVDRPWALAKCVLLLERQANALEANGVRGIPLLYFFTIGGAKAEPVRPEIMQALIFTAKQRGPVAVWNGWGEYSDAGKALPPITAEQKGWLK